ncbi:MAG: site-2 protease family protein [Clostridia bacterium]|nr:site-2 protease family protein [Clostridia bacterium]
MVILYILLALFVFGVMILVHELGHFTFAKIFKVAINEFSIGMGPKIFSKKLKDGVQYSLRLFPIGGFVAMEGETEESDNPNSFDKKPAYQRFIIVAAGAVVNIIVAIIIVFFLSVTSPYFGTTTIASFEGDVDAYQGLMPNDEIISVENTKVSTVDELSYAIMMNGSKPVDIMVLRDGKEHLVEDVVFPTQEKDGFVYGQMNFKVYGEKKTIGNVIKNTYHTSLSTVKMIWDSIIGLITGKFGFKQISGPVGVTGAMVDVARQGPYSFFFFVSVISMNLGIFNLLPIPALDGGTLLFTAIEMIFRKRVPKKIEDTLKLAAFALLILLVIVVSIKDVIMLII